MNLSEQRGGWVILISFIIALMLLAIPLPQWLSIARPEWAALVVIYWAIAVPNRFGLISAWAAGLLQDILMGNIMGLHAMSFVIISYITLRLYQRIRISTILRQSLTVLMLMLLNQFILLWIYNLTGHKVGGLIYWLPSITSALVWPLIFLLLRHFQSQFTVS